MGRSAEAGELIKFKEREARIDKLAKNLTRDLLYGTGDIGRRMRVDPERESEALKNELLSRGNYHELLVRTHRFTERVLPPEFFKREDGKTPYIFHADRTALLLQDHLLTRTDLSPNEIATRVAIMQAHDSEEEPQEMLMKNVKEKLPLMHEAVEPQEETKAIFDEEMEGLHPDLAPFAERIYQGINAFNRHNPDNSTKFDEDYIEGLKDFAPEKIIDRGMDSPHGDMSRIARMVEDALADPEKLATLQEDLTPRYKRLEKSINKARKLRALAKDTPEDIQELFEATIRAGDKFQQAINMRLADETRRRGRFRWMRSIKIFPTNRGRE